MSTLKTKLKDTSLFRRVSVINLFLTNVSFVQIPAYAVLVFLFVWGVGLVIYNQKRYNTFFNMRFGLWIGAFIAVNILTMLVNFSVMILYGLVVLAHLFICFFIFYGMHTEPDFNFKEELYFIARLIVYFTTVANIIGMICLLCGFSFEWMWIKFTIYENRFTGVYINPNNLGFAAVVSMVCCHMLYKPDFMSAVTQPRISKIWVFTCIATNFFSLMLCDSNASLVLALGYVICYIVYMFFADKTGIGNDEKKVSKSKIFIKVVSLVLVGAFLSCFMLVFRTICQAGFSKVVSGTNALITLIVSDESEITEILEEEEEVSFTHENSNVDSGRFKLWSEAVVLFGIDPVIGISDGNIIYYSQKYGTGYLEFSYHRNDLHNGFLTILVSTGIVGFLLFCIFGFRFTKHTAQHMFLQKRTQRNDILPCLFSFLFAYLMFSFFEKSLLYDVFSFFVMWFWLMMGYASCFVFKRERKLGTVYIFNSKRITRAMI